MLMPGSDFPKALTLGLLASLALFIALLLINKPLQTGAAPKGIVSFQMAGTLDRASEILESWDSNAVASARASLWLDFAFAGAYVLTLLLLTNFSAMKKALSPVPTGINPVDLNWQAGAPCFWMKSVR